MPKKIFINTHEVKMFSFTKLAFLACIVLFCQKALAFNEPSKEDVGRLRTTYSLILDREEDDTIPEAVAPKNKAVPIEIIFLPTSPKPAFIVPTNKTPGDIQPTLDSFFGLRPYQKRRTVGEHIEFLQGSNHTMYAVQYRSQITEDEFRKQILRRSMLLQNLAL